jgi:DNA-binding winged helix-turn-helix (wHTH) protein
MPLVQNLLSGKRHYVIGLLLLSFICVICAAYTKEDNNDFDFDRREVLLRRIGHELLLQSGDSTSRVLPIKKIAENEYQIRFENDFTFQSNALVNTTQRLLTKDSRTSDYVVNVLNCADSSVAYGYAVSKNKKNDIIACIGRKQPVACYRINIKFQPTEITTVKNGFILSSVSFLVVAGFIFLRSGTQRKILSESHNADRFTWGSILFDAKNRKLNINGTIIDLTGTETRVLLIFALSPNEIVERTRLQKEVWEDEGVVVGRSLDIFISKLRKKLELDPNIKIVVIRGKGYKLAIET